MREKSLKWTCLLLALAGLLFAAAGCVYPQGYQDWEWKQYNPTYQPLPGDPQR